MDDERMGEIALALIRHYIQNEGVRLSEHSFKRDLGNVAKGTGIPRGDLIEFAEVLLNESLSNILSGARKSAREG